MWYAVAGVYIAVALIWALSGRRWYRGRDLFAWTIIGIFWPITMLYCTITNAYLDYLVERRWRAWRMGQFNERSGFKK